MKYRLIATVEGDRVAGCQEGSSDSLEAIAYWVGSDGHPAELYFDGELFLPSGQHREEGWISVELMRHAHGWTSPRVAA